MLETVGPESVIRPGDPELVLGPGDHTVLFPPRRVKVCSFFLDLVHAAPLGLMTVFPCLMAVLMSMWSWASVVVAFVGMCLIRRGSMELLGPRLIQAGAGLTGLSFPL